MRTQTARNAVLASIGLAALTIYILACTSFSPDDRKVLYPAFDGAQGVIGTAVYDRSSRQSEIAFTPTVFGDGTNLAASPMLLRSQWFTDGRRILHSWAPGDSGLCLTVTSAGSRGPVRTYLLPAIEKAQEKMMFPIALAGDRVFLMESADAVLRLDLTTGALERRQLGVNSNKIAIYPSPRNDAVFYLEDRDSEGKRVFGRLNPDTFATTPLVTFTNDFADGSFFAYNSTGTRLGGIEKAGEVLRLVVLETGKPSFTRLVNTNAGRLSFGSATFSPKGDTLLASFGREETNAPQTSFGLMEIPLSQAPIRETVLLSGVKSSEGVAALYFQVGVSHDGKTAAAASTYLAATVEESKPEDCALFFIDLTDAKRKVTRVPIPMPAQRLKGWTK
jgi:hypothetical protein